MYKSVKKYIDFKVYSVTRIKNKYGFRIVFTLSDNSLDRNLDFQPKRKQIDLEIL